MQSLARNTVFRASLARHFTRNAPRAGVHTLPEMPYAYNALEPHISGKIMELHHSKHHQTYVNGLNAAEEALKKASTTQQLISIQSALKFNGGGHVNHSFFWKILAPTSEGGGKVIDGQLKTNIEAQWGTVDAFKKDMNAKTAAIQGSGWGWLVYNKTIKKLEIITTPNQDPVLEPYVPIIGIDIWEHAFYLQYLNVKPDYLNAIWNVINWKQAEDNYKAATK